MNRRRDMAVFLERQSYRRRRLMDALRLLPVLGVMLWMFPLFWPPAPEPGTAEPVPMSTAVLYVFAVWLLLIAAAFALWRVLWRGEPEAGGDRTHTGAEP